MSTVSSINANDKKNIDDNNIEFCNNCLKKEQTEKVYQQMLAERDKSIKNYKEKEKKMLRQSMAKNCAKEQNFPLLLRLTNLNMYRKVPKCSVNWYCSRS